MESGENQARLKNEHGFTLLELVIVIVILGILATLGYTQYTRLMERIRIGEAVVNIGKMRKNAIAYYLENGSFASITSADLGVGSDMPSGCVSTNYFYYFMYQNDATHVAIAGCRCTSGGKSPNYTSSPYWIFVNPLYGNGIGTMDCYVPGGDPAYPSWCEP
ncbi:MAG: type II secretion system protein [Candidatus Omnitrophica bacterium]|nr:type II secretion system protein [Candidatus Omnitrophota bacterium]